MSGGIFVSYRKNYKGGRRTHALAVDAFIERLRTHFGPEKVHADTGLVAGEHYPSALRGWLNDSEVLLVLVHREWFVDLRARARQEERDWVRWEVQKALELGIYVLPVLLDKATLPSKDRLLEAGFDDIAELGTRQYWRIDFGDWQQGGAELMRLLENRVATEELPAPQRQEPVRVRSFWPALVAALIGFVAPWLSVRLLLPDAELRQVWLIALAAALVFALVIPLATVAIVYAVRARFDEGDQHLAELSHDTKTNVTVGAVVAGLGTAFLFTSNLLPWQGQLVFLAVIVGFFVTEGDRWLRDRRRGDGWPYAYLAPSPPSVRGALAHVDRFLTAHRPLLTRAQREQVEFALGQVEWAVDRLGELSALSRWAWLRRSAIWLPALHVLLVASVLGSAVFAVVVGGWDYLGLLVGSVVAAALCHFATVDRAYRLQRWRRKVVADTAPAEVNRLRKRLAEISIPPADPQENAE